MAMPCEGGQAAANTLPSAGGLLRCLCSPRPEVFLSKGVARTRLQILLKSPRNLNLLKGKVSPYPLGSKLACVRAASRIMSSQPPPEVGSVSDILLCRIAEALNDVRIKQFSLSERCNVRAIVKQEPGQD